MEDAVHRLPRKLLSAAQNASRRSGDARSRFPACPLSRLRVFFLSLPVLLLAFLPPARAAVRFDMFVGHDGIVPQGAWFPIAFEVFNDGQPFTAVLEVTPGQYNQSQTRSMVVELPTGTTKRFILPLHTSATYNPIWNARLLDEKGRVRAETQNPRIRRLSPASLPLAAAMSRTLPPLPEFKSRNTDAAPLIARLQPLIFPDNPIALEGLDTIYLASERVFELKQPQVNALLAWLYGGGHLIVGIEQLNHLSGPGEWLRQVLPADLNGMTQISPHAQLHDWLISKQRFDGRDYTFTGSQRTGRTVTTGSYPNPFEKLAVDPTFNEAPLQVATGTLRDGRVLAGPAATPTVIIARRGRGQVTLLTFAPELEPFKSWRHAPYFWAKMTDMPPEFLSDNNPNNYYNTYTSGRSLDGIFGAMIDSDQIRKLPVGWLLLLLIGYLAVIGPLDQYWLKKLNKQMLTWITFPCYVVFFSLLIYFIGYKLRAGESEWNELHVIDVIPHSQGEDSADLRGRTFGSIYSPVNAKYSLVSEQPFATLRGELMGNLAGGAEASRANVQQQGNSFHGIISVPVWTSQLFVSDWLRQQATPVTFTLTTNQITVDNRLDTRIPAAKLVLGKEILDLEAIPANQIKTFDLGVVRKTSLDNFVRSHANNFNAAVQSRQHAFGDNSRARVTDKAAGTMAASFIGLMNTANNYENFGSPPGFDLNPLLQRGDAVLLAWLPNYSPVKPLNKFSARRNHHNTLLRVAAPVER
jgi:hypothetical protein